jgi:hypothetical protein
MTDYNENSKLKLDPSSNMAALKSAISNGEENKIKMLLTNLLFDEVQKADLIKFAELSGNPEIVELLEGAPATP